MDFGHIYVLRNSSYEGITIYVEFNDTLWHQGAILNMCFPFNWAISSDSEGSTGKGEQRGDLARNASCMILFLQILKDLMISNIIPKYACICCSWENMLF